jgi:hypothetical protein
VLPNSRLKDQGAAYGGPVWGESVIRLACPLPIPLAARGLTAVLARVGRQARRSMDTPLAAAGWIWSPTANPLGGGQPLKGPRDRPRRALDVKAASRRKRWPTASLDIVARDEISREDEGMV